MSARSSSHHSTHFCRLHTLSGVTDCQRKKKSRRQNRFPWQLAFLFLLCFTETKSKPCDCHTYGDGRRKREKKQTFDEMHNSPTVPLSDRLFKKRLLSFAPGTSNLNPFLRYYCNEKSHYFINNLHLLHNKII